MKGLQEWGRREGVEGEREGRIRSTKGKELEMEGKSDGRNGEKKLS